MDGVEQRQYPRFGLGVPVTLVFSARGVSADGELQDISRGGCFFKSTIKVDIHRKISVVFSSDRGQTWRASGSVIRTVAYRGFAVLFEEGTEPLDEVLQELARQPQESRAAFLTTILNPKIEIL
ncbi:MAG TPA: PilZ domain-containing protein [Polyangia bacterium]|jgi:hypothetical protein|nr:PilZ domain-containing protein [Polyangia bacterium]